MPTYDYECEHCGHTFEAFQSIKAEPLKTCPSCKRKALRRLIGCGAGVIFKGAGFYATDYRSKDYQKKAKADKESSSKPSGSGGPSSSGEKKGKTEKTASGVK